MAVNVKAVNKTLFDAGGRIDAGEVRSDMLTLYDSYVTDASEVVTSTLKLANLPEGAKIMGIEITTGALGAGVTIAVGDSTSATRYMAATAHAAAGVLRDVLAAGINYVIGTNDGDEVILLTFAGATLTTAIPIKVLVRYTM